MTQFNYVIYEPHWHKEYRCVDADSLEDAKAKVADDRYCGDHQDDELFYESIDFGKRDNAKMLDLIEWDVTDDTSHYPIVVLHQNLIFTLNGPDDIQKGQDTGLRGLRQDLEHFLQGKKAKFTYVKPADFVQMKRKEEE